MWNSMPGSTLQVFSMLTLWIPEKMKKELEKMLRDTKEHGFSGSDLFCPGKYGDERG